MAAGERLLPADASLLLCRTAVQLLRKGQAVGTVAPVGYHLIRTGFCFCHFAICCCPLAWPANQCRHGGIADHHYLLRRTADDCLLRFCHVAGVAMDS